jgi:hypothetical protein
MVTKVLLNIPNPFDKHSSLLYIAKGQPIIPYTNGISYEIVIGRGVRGGQVFRFEFYRG